MAGLETHPCPVCAAPTIRGVDHNAVKVLLDVNPDRDGAHVIVSTGQSPVQVRNLSVGARFGRTLYTDHVRTCTNPAALRKQIR